MRLLVSVARATEVPIALAGGADIIDAKDPSRGALGAVAPGELAAIVQALGGARPLSVALGDASHEALVSRAVTDSASTGADFVKIGFGGIGSTARAESLARTAVDAAHGSRARVVLVAYADASRVSAIAPHRIPDLVHRVGASAGLLDTACKDGGSLFALMTPDRVAAWVRQLQDAGILAALAGSLDAAGVSRAVNCGADVVGVRGAACDGGREGNVTLDRVKALVSRCRYGSMAGHTAADAAGDVLAATASLE